MGFFCSPETAGGDLRSINESVKDFFCRGHVTSCWLSSVFLLQECRSWGLPEEVVELVAC